MVSVLFNESKLLKCPARVEGNGASNVSVLFNESKLLKLDACPPPGRLVLCFSTLQRVEIAEIYDRANVKRASGSFSTLQRVEIAEIGHVALAYELEKRFQYSSTSRNC